MTSETVNASGETSLLASDSSPVSNPSKVVQPDGQRSKLPVRLASIVGVAIAFALVLVWFPKTWNMWNMPIQAVDAPSHYYFIRKLLKNGLSVAFELNPNDSFYPPLFHILVYMLIKLAGLFGISVNIFTGLNLVWLLTSGLIFPAGMLLWCSYFFSDLPRSYRVMMSLIVPILSVTSAAHPYWLFNAGPLFAYGLATSLLPFSLYAGLRLIDVLTVQTDRRSGTIIHWVLINLFLAILILLAHPRIAFTYLVFMVFFVLFKLPWKFILSTLGVIFLAVIFFLGYVTYRDHGKDYFHPSSWFHTFQPTRSLSDALQVVMTDFMPGLSGVFVTAFILTALAASLILSNKRFKDGLSLVLIFLLTSTIFVSSAALKGTFANIITAAWYRGETRPLSMIPLATVPLLVFGFRCILMRFCIKAEGYEVANSKTESSAYQAVDRTSLFKELGYNKKLHSRFLLPNVFLSILIVLVIVVTLCNPSRAEQAAIASSRTDFGSNEKEQLTQAKYEVLTDVFHEVGPRAVVISDPLNGSMYGMALYGINMLYPVYNPMDTKHGKVFGQVEKAFSSGDSQELLASVCPVDPSYSSHGRYSSAKEPKYFLSMGSQAPSLQFFTYKSQYDPFHNSDLIEGYEKTGALRREKTYDSFGAYSRDWALYRFSCQ